MKLCVIVQNLYTLGGVQRVVTTILNRLAEKGGYDITILMPFQMTGKKHFVIDGRIAVRDLGELYDGVEPHRLLFAANRRLGFLECKALVPLAARLRFSSGAKERLASFLNEERFQIVIGTGSEYSMLLGEISDSVTAKTVGWQHSTFQAYFETPGYMAYRLARYAGRCYGRLDGVWVLTKADQAEFDKKMGLSSKVCYNPTDLNISVLSAYEKGYVLYAGRLAATQKGLDYLVDIMSRIVWEFPDSRLIIVGDGRDRPFLEERIRSLGLEHSVSLVGSTDNVYQYYAKASVLLLTSRWEGFGLTITEAMSCGVPVVSFHNFGPDEIIRDGVDGFLVEKFNVDDFAEKAVRILKDQDLRARMGEQAKARAAEFGIDKLLPVFEGYLREMAEG